MRSGHGDSSAGGGCLPAARKMVLSTLQHRHFSCRRRTNLGALVQSVSFMVLHSSWRVIVIMWLQTRSIKSNAADASRRREIVSVRS